jgi:hypothetical protein
MLEHVTGYFKRFLEVKPELSIEQIRSIIQHNGTFIPSQNCYIVSPSQLKHQVSTSDILRFCEDHTNQGNKLEFLYKWPGNWDSCSAEHRGEYYYLTHEKVALVRDTLNGGQITFYYR